MTAEPRLRVLMFHHAGGSGLSYLSLAGRLPGWCDARLFELSGRGMREDEPFAPDYTAAVAGLLPHVVEALDRPAVLFGHSLGGLIAHSVACALPPSALDLLATVVVSSAYSPMEAAGMARHPGAPFQVRTRNQLLAELRGRGGCPPETLRDPDFVSYALRVLGHDLHLADTYVPASGAVADFQVWYGGEDPYLTAEQARDWVGAVARPPLLRAFPGGHFYLTQRPEAGQALAELAHSLS
ncbi:pyoverdine synthetase thioesterase component [Acrocarpospora phusangensis]|uniref:Pyoverdine synthetase thioesterase component n=1 Tax=Acrocarpospora phusangensis TaxID=1070424 RepID=A0A919QCM8_9ACTN|nr:alpha/beta fold hydrolase [Acrocarpospora phusangensis]GIH26482.1 pyoverdine synthetase thioesterase component [Acrocarpospora phusangensis]